MSVTRPTLIVLAAGVASSVAVVPPRCWTGLLVLAARGYEDTGRHKKQ